MKQCMGCMEMYDASLDVCPHCGYDDSKSSSHILHMIPGTILHKRYVVGKALGYGSFGVTYIGWDKIMRRKVAIKEYLPSEYATRMIQQKDLIIPNEEAQQVRFEKGKTKFRQEAEKLGKLGKVDGVVYIYDTFEENHTVYIIMEYLQGMTLAAYMAEKGALSQEETMDIMFPILEALDQVHEQGIIHRDISPDNIFMSTDTSGKQQVKLIDFGAARFASSSHSKSLTVLLRPGYSPEEQYRSGGEQGPHTDIYAVAAVMYQMVTGIRPADALERRTSIERKKRDLVEDPSKYNKNLTENFETAIMNAMNVRLEDRTPIAAAFANELVSVEKVARRGSYIKKIDFFKWPLWAKIATVGSAFAAIAVIVGVTYWLTHLAKASDEITLPDGYTYVVDFEGKTLEEATASANDHLLSLSEGEATFSSRIPNGMITGQDVLPFLVVKENSNITVSLCTGEEEYNLPDVVGYTQEEAVKALECMDLEVIPVIGEEVVPGVAAGCVIEQSLEPYAEVKTGETIFITVADSENAKAGKAPKLVGLTYEDALKTAANAGTNLVVTEKIFTDEHDHTEILTQSVPEGADFTAEDDIEVTIALAPRDFRMPSLSYKSKEKALQLLKNIGIAPKIEDVFSELLARDIVAKQSMEAKKTVRPNEDVAISISQGGAPFEMPDLAGKSEKEVRELLGSLGLVANVEYGFKEDIKVDYLISQGVAKGEKVSRGDEINVLICSEEAIIIVPDTANMTADAAAQELKNIGFTVKTVEVYSDQVVAGSIISMEPTAGSKQVAGTTVILNVSKGAEPKKEVEEKPQPTQPQPTQSQSQKPQPTQPAEKPSKPEPTWSGWLAALPSGVSSSNHTVETKTQYRFQTKKTTTSTSASMDGWTRYNAVDSYGNWGGWSDWSTSSVGASDVVQTESKEQYQYRDYVQTGSTPVYGAWSAWQDQYVAPSSTLDVTTQQVVTQTHYKMGHWCTGKAGGYQTCYTQWAGDDYFKQNSVYHEIGWTTSLPAVNTYTGSVPAYRYDKCSNGCFNFYVMDQYSDYKTQYAYRSISYNPVYDWTGWTGWQDSPVYSSGSRQVNSRTVYHYRTRSKSTTYYYEQWSGWSDWSDGTKSSDTNTNVEVRTLYRYK